MLERDVGLAGSRFVQHGVAVRERPALRVLAREADRNPLLEQRRESECLSMPPVDTAFVESVSPALELLGQLRIDLESVRHARGAGR